jgi:hypothetical protein
MRDLQAIVLVIALASAAAPAQGVLDRLKQRIDQMNQTGQKQPGQKQVEQKPQPPASRQQQGKPQQQPSQPSNSTLAEPTTTTADVAAIAAAAGIVDVAGMKPGMTVKDTILALRAANPDLKLTPNTFRLVGLGDQDLMDTVRADSLSGDQYMLEFTLPPTHEVLWGLMRIIKFDEKHRPTAANTIAELRKKYGPESGSIAGSQFYWGFDTRGNPIDWVKPGGCAPQVQGLQSDVTNGYSPDSHHAQDGQNQRDCSKAVMLSAALNLDNSEGPSKGTVVTLTVSMEHGALHRAAADATYAVALRAQRAQDAKDASDAQKRTVPKL